MYPNLYFFCKETFNWEIPFLRLVNTFGFFVALAFFTAAFVLQKEMKRKEKEGLLFPTAKKILIGEPATLWELFTQFFIGFLIGFKFIGLFFMSDNPYFNPQNYIFSFQGNWWGGLILGGLFAYLRFREKNKQKRAQPIYKEITIHPYERIGDLTLIAFIAGFIGAKIFHNLENWRTFIANPIGELFSLGGLTFYGGLIVATISILLYARHHKMNLWVIGDCFAPVMMIAYAVGRLGCQFSGDGDWGILNSAYISNLDAQLIPTTSAYFQQALINNSPYYIEQFGSLNAVPHLFFDPSWLPMWLKANNYFHNVLGEGFLLSGCEGNYCAFLPVSVFPTPIYEAIACTLLFILIWQFRKRLKITGYITALYLFLAGIERFFIEKIRVNTKYHIGGLSFTQAELISILFIFAALFIVYYHKNRIQKINRVR